MDELFINSSSITSGFYVAYENGVVSRAASNSMCSAALLLWRSITFAFPIIVAGFVSAFYKSSPKDIVGRDGSIPNRRTLTQLQAETMAERNLELDTLIETQQLTRQAVMEKLKASSNNNRKKHINKSKDKSTVRKEDMININDGDDGI